MSAIPFNRESDVTPGASERLSPLVRRVVAPNPGPFTFTGTNTFIVGTGEVAVIDPGPPGGAHLDALVRALHGETVSHILVTHTHADHSPLARPLQARLGGTVIGPARMGAGAPLSGPRVEEENDTAFAPDRVLTGGETVAGPGWTLGAVATPGHTANHLCYALAEENTAFTGDHVMGWSTSVVIPPDGDMDDYLASLEKIRIQNYALLRPAHGGPVREPRAFLDAYIAHRLKREAQILERLAAGPASIRAIVAALYGDVDKRLHGAAALSVHAHLIRLVRQGRAASEGPATLDAVYALRK